MDGTTHNSTSLFTGTLASNNSSYGTRVFSEWYFIVINTIFIPPTVFGNTLIIVSLIRFPKLLRIRAYILVGNLAVSDLFVGLLVLPLDLSLTVSKSATESYSICLWYYSLVYTFVGLSIINLFILSLERFSAVVSPFSHNTRFTKKRIYVTILVTWITGIVIGCLPVFGLHNPVPENFHCMTSHHVLLPMYTRIVLSVLMLSLIINTVFFFVIVRIATNKLQSLPSSLSGKYKLRKNVRHTCNMLIITGLFIVFWTPFGVVAFLPGESNTLYILKDVTASLGFINSCLNWIVYGYRCKMFRAAFKSIVMCKCVQKDFKLPMSSTG